MVVDSIEKDTIKKLHGKVIELQDRLFSTTFGNLFYLKHQHLLLDILKQAISENQRITQIKSQTVEEIDLRLKKEERKNQALKLELMQQSKKLNDEQFKKSLFSDKVNDLLEQIKKKDQKIQSKEEIITKLKAFAEKLSQKYKPENIELKKKVAELQN